MVETLPEATQTPVVFLLGARLIAIAKAICERVGALKPAGELPGRQAVAASASL